VISRLGIIYFPDQLGALAEMRRVLRPGGRLAAVAWSTPENGRFFSVAVGIIRRRAQLAPPLPGQPGPFSLSSDGVLAAGFEQAGCSDVSVQASTPTGRRSRDGPPNETPTTPLLGASTGTRAAPRAHVPSVR
jgi:SAM-dependent methyltransferase